MPADRPPKMRATIRISIARRGRRQDAGRHGQHDAEEEHASCGRSGRRGAQPQDRRGEAQRVADGDEVERHLRGVERGADRRQRDVRDREIEVRDGRDEDQRREDQSPTLGTRGDGRRASANRRRRGGWPRSCRLPLGSSSTTPYGPAANPRPSHSGFEAGRDDPARQIARVPARWFGTDANTRRCI